MERIERNVTQSRSQRILLKSKESSFHLSTPPFPRWIGLGTREILESIRVTVNETPRAGIVHSMGLWVKEMGSKGVRDESGGDIPLTVPGTGTFIASFRVVVWRRCFVVPCNWAFVFLDKGIRGRQISGRIEDELFRNGETTILN